MLFAREGQVWLHPQSAQPNMHLSSVRESKAISSREKTTACKAPISSARRTYSAAAREDSAESAFSARIQSLLCFLVSARIFRIVRLLRAAMPKYVAAFSCSLSMKSARPKRVPLRASARHAHQKPARVHGPVFAQQLFGVLQAGGIAAARWACHAHAFGICAIDFQHARLGPGPFRPRGKAVWMPAAGKRPICPVDGFAIRRAVNAERFKRIWQAQHLP